LKSFVYLVGYIIFTFIEHCIKGFINGDELAKVIGDTLSYLVSKDSIINIIMVFIVFLIFSTFWIIRNYIGAKELLQLFFKKVK